MAVYEMKGDLLMADVDYICHQVNCQGVMDSGIAKSVKNKMPIVYKKYQEWFEYACNEAIKNSHPKYSLNPSDIMLGHIQTVSISNGKVVVNMAAQEYYGYDGKRYTSYDAFWSCLGEILKQVPKDSSIGFPYGIGSIRGGANWNVIYTMIKEALSEHYKVYIYQLEGDN